MRSWQALPVVLAACCPTGRPVAAQDRPNIVFVMADDK
jgi:hypothetical protein